MRKVLSRVLLCLLLTNCALLGRLQEGANDPKCVSHGADSDHDPAYARCRAGLGAVRSQQTTPLPTNHPEAPGAGTLTIPN